MSENFLRADALIVRLVFLTGFTDNFFPRFFDQRARAAAAILALPATLIFRRFLGAGVLVVLVDPKSLTNLFSSDSICPFNVAASFNCFTVKLIIVFMLVKSCVWPQKKSTGSCDIVWRQPLPTLPQFS